MNSPHTPRRRLTTTLRLRLTLIYGALFFIAGMVLLGTTYVLVGYQLPPVNAVFSVQKATQEKVAPPAGVAGAPPEVLRTADGTLLDPGEAPKYLAKKQDELRAVTQNSLLIQGGIALLLVGSVSIGFGWLITGRVLAPLHRVTETARRIAHARAADRGLHERIALDSPDNEVRELADTFDAMLERLDRSFESQSRFVANASHELRTPLTLNRALVEVAMHRKSASADVKQLGETLLEINARHERLINGLLLLARSENEVLRRADVDLADVVSHVVAQSAKEAGEAGVAVHEQPGAAHTTGDPILLERLAQNLVDNGIRHNLPTGGSVEVTSRTLPYGQVELTVANTGTVIPPYEVPTLFEPFRRLGDDRLVTAKGAGLGLSIVRSVARAHGGEATAAPRKGGGLVVTVRLPGGAPAAGADSPHKRTSEAYR